jgi:hypothetical protein
MKRFFIPFCIFPIILVIGSVVAAFCQLDSDRVNWDTVLVVLALFSAPFSIFAAVKIVRRKLLALRMVLGAYVVAVLVAWGLFSTILQILVPSYIRYTVSYPGNVGSYHEVRFQFRHNGQWLDGPTVEGWPMTFSFPDLNNDGYRDIRVTDKYEQKSVEFTYMPKNDGRCFWHPVKNNSRLSASYPPANYYSNYP